MRAAIVSMACCYPDAGTPETLWQNVLEGRRAFRAIPSERIALARYAAAMVGEADSVTAVKAGLLTDWQFDCDRFRIPQSTFTAADLSHWLALEVAADAIANAGGPDVLDRERTAVVVANTLTGEFSRAALLRLRAPFLDEILAEAGEACGLDDDRACELRRRFGAILRGRFPEPTEESLAGALANTIAGRIANHFDLYGGAYSIDGACASSLVAVADAANLLALDQADAVLVGAVDLSLDPFELVGFSRNGALSRDEMRVFDQRSSGFWPGEGAGFLLLMRDDEARRRGLPVRATLRGWGISSDGAGGLTRPSADGQLRALRRAHEMAVTDPADIGYVEAHGTGTSVGDAIEVTALARWRNGAKAALPIGSIKANIGHTKAAAGLAGLIKTVGVLSLGYVPPHVGCAIPHQVFRDVHGAIRPALEGEAWPAQSPRLAGVSCFGFGGINAHVVLECSDGARSVSPTHRPHRIQDAELFVFAASDRDTLAAQMVALRNHLAALSLAEFIDAAASCARTAESGPWRAAIVAREPNELADKLEIAIATVRAGGELIDSEQGIHVALRSSPPRIGLLFPGQAAPSRPHGGLWARRFDQARAATAAIPPAGGDAVRTEIAQPAIVAASITAWRLLQAAGLEASMAAGHSLGELTALAWAGAIADDDLLRLAAMRGAIIARYGRVGGTMLRIAAGAADVTALIGSIGLAHELAIACRNGPRETVISGPAAAIAIAEARASSTGLETTALSVSHAFHSAMIAPAVPPFIDALAEMRLEPLQRQVASTVTGTVLAPNADLRDVLVRQLTAPVEFEQAMRRLRDTCDLLIEVGPGSGLSRLARGFGATVTSVDAFADSLVPMLTVLGAAHALGANLKLDVLFADRPTRTLAQTTPRFLANPCGSHKATDAAPVPMVDPPHRLADPGQPEDAAASTDVFALVRSVIAAETGFAADKIQPDDRFLDDLHLNSLAVSRIAAKAARMLSCSPPVLPGELARGTPRTLSNALAELSRLKPEARGDHDRIQGVRPWVRPFAVRWVQAERPGAVRMSAWDVLPIQAAPDDRSAIAAIASRPGQPDGLLIWLGTMFEEASTHDLFAACRTAWATPSIVHLAICHAGAPVSAFAQALAVEGRFQSVSVIERPIVPDAFGSILDELDAASTGFVEARLDAAGLRWVPELVSTTPTCRPEAGLRRNDVVLAIGGAKGIGAECALRIGERFGAALILVGRAQADDPAVIATLARAAAVGTRCRYIAADVCDEIELTRAVAVATEFGPVTVLLHAAGLNDPAPFDKISDEELHRILAPKTAGLRNAIAAAGPRLRRIITFGSILGRVGLHGETHYGIANAWQSVIATGYVRENCHVLSLEWSVWNGVGMGHRLGSIERLAQLGVDAMPVDAALDTFEELVRDGAVGTSVITSRFGLPPHLSRRTTRLPLLRFVDNILLHYPGVELIVETELSRGRDPYLSDHRINGITVFPGVLGLEAMAQAACALGGWASPAAIEAVAFSQAVVIPDDAATPIRIMALAEDDDRIVVVIRSGEDAFASDRMRATFARDPVSTVVATDHCAVESTTLFDARQLYGPLFFHGERFRCVQNYRHLTARRVAATLSRPDDAPCFSQFEPQQLVLGDPFLHDAVLHGLQAAAPHRVLVPVSIGQISQHARTPPVRMEAVERKATDDFFLFDIITREGTGAIVEHWQQVAFRAIARTDIDAAIAITPELQQAYIERVARAALSDASIEVALIRDRERPRNARRSGALAVLRLDGEVFSRTDGKPVLSSCHSQTGVSIAHREAVTLAVRASSPIGCDIERVADWARPDALLPLSPSMAALTAKLAGSGEPLASAAARVWSLCEAAAKHAQPSEQRWTQRAFSDGVMVFEAAAGQTVTMHLPGLDGDLMIAIATRNADPPIVVHALSSLQERIA